MHSTPYALSLIKGLRTKHLYFLAITVSLASFFWQAVDKKKKTLSANNASLILLGSLYSKDFVTCRVSASALLLFDVLPAHSKKGCARKVIEKKKTKQN